MKKLSTHRETGIKKTCPACKTLFDCQQQDISRCFCFKIELTTTQREEIAGRWSGCLCNSCLTKVSQGAFNVRP